MLSYTSNNPDPLKVHRTIKIDVSRPNVRDLIYRPWYKLKRPDRK
jgi:hypothetical protein